MVIGHRPVGIISNTVMSDLIESHICESVCVHVYAAYPDTKNYKIRYLKTTSSKPGHLLPMRT